jgi:predicted DsbA family dithiol-disulfide isomerase
MSSPLVIDYYSDILCVWAWIAQRRIDELEEQWGDKVVLQYHYLNLFGDTAARIEAQWRDRGGYEGFGRHVQESAAPYDSAPVNEVLWKTVRPSTSANAHLMLKAVGLVYCAETEAKLALNYRKAFFIDGQDIGRLSVVLGIASDQGLDSQLLKETVESGAAIAGLMTDYAKAQEQNVKGSPTWIMNNGRQILYGNVGYRVLHANIEEILKSPELSASWC